MVNNFYLVKVSTDYCNYLRKIDNKVTYNEGKKELRPFVGVLLKIKGLEYFAPLSSPKAKHLKMKNTLDFMKINHGTLGVINFNNMIPVNKNNYVLLDLNKIPQDSQEQIYYYLLLAQLSWLNANKIQVVAKAQKLYNLYINGKLFVKIKDRCCNFPLLEEKCKEYNLVGASSN